MLGGYGMRPTPKPHNDLWKTAFDSPHAEKMLTAGHEPAGVGPSIRALTEWLHLEQGQTVLEIGCGMGDLIVPMAQAGFQMIGLDYSSVQLGRARKKAQAAGVNCQWIQGDMRECPLRHPVDAAFMAAGTFGHLEDDSQHIKALQAVAKVLKPEGRLYVDTFNRDFVPDAEWEGIVGKKGDQLVRIEQSIDYWTDRMLVRIVLEQEGAYPEDITMDLQVFTLHDWIRLAEESGFTLERATSGLGPYPNNYNPRAGMMLGVVLVKRPPAAPGGPARPSPAAVVKRPPQSPPPSSSLRR